MSEDDQVCGIAFVRIKRIQNLKLKQVYIIHLYTLCVTVLEEGTQIYRNIANKCLKFWEKENPDVFFSSLIQN